MIKHNALIYMTEQAQFNPVLIPILVSMEWIQLDGLYFF